MQQGIESVRTVIVPTVSPRDKPRTLADYQADLIRRYGKVPAWQEMAKLECGKIHKIPKAQQHGHRQNAVAARIALGDVTRRAIMAALTKSMTTKDLATSLNKTPYMIRHHMRALKAAGLVMCIKGKKFDVWKAVQQ